MEVMDTIKEYIMSTGTSLFHIHHAQSDVTPVRPSIKKAKHAWTNSLKVTHTDTDKIHTE